MKLSVEISDPESFDLKTRLSFAWFHAIQSPICDPLHGSWEWRRYLPGPRRDAENIVALAFTMLTDKQKADAVNFDPSSTPA
jgi:hypothetical protein